MKILFEKGHKINLGRVHPGWRRRINSVSHMGKTHTLVTRLKMSESAKAAHRSGRHPMYRGGVTPLIRAIRNSLEYKLWREAVFSRDDYRCYDCGQRGGRLNADHVYAFSQYPRLRFMVENGRTLCENCHRQTPTYGSGSRIKNNTIAYGYC